MSEEAKTTMVRIDSLLAGDVVMHNDTAVTVVSVYRETVNGTMMVYVENGDEWGDNIHDRTETMVQLVSRANVRGEEVRPTHTPEPWLIGELSRETIHAANDVTFVSTCFGSRLQGEANAARIVSCVNAMEGIADPSAVPIMIRLLERIASMMTEDTDSDIFVEVLMCLNKIKGGSQ